MSSGMREPVRGGDLLAAALAAQGVQAIFGLPGVQLDLAFDALARQDAIRVYHTRHEQAVSYMADGYARTLGRVGCCLVVPGPGLLNAMAGLATAYACSSPVLCIVGQVRSELIGAGLGLLHEIPDQLGVARSVAKWTGTAMRPDEIPALVAEAIGRARSGRPRPAVLEVPPDVLEATVPTRPELPLADDDHPRGDAEILEQAAGLLGQAERPLIVAGGGVLAAAAWDELRELAERLAAPVLLTAEARGALSSHHPLAFDPPAGPDLVAGADVILAVGTRFAGPSGLRWRLEAGQRLVRIDADPEELTRAIRPEIAIEADARAALSLLVDLVPAPDGSGWRGLDRLQEQVHADLESVQPQAAFGAAIRRALPEETVVLGGMTQVGYWMRVGFPVYRPRTYLGPGYQGTLGFELPTGLGAQVAAPDRRVVVIAGDGGFLYNTQELATAVQLRIPVISVVFNDNAYGNVRRTQRQQFGRVIASDLLNPDFVRLAEAYGVTGRRTGNPDGLAHELAAALDRDGPTLIEVPVSEMVDPWPVVMRRRAH